jgi:hypothetical protein
MLGTPSDDLTAMVDGIWEHDGWSDPTSVIKCYNTDPALSEKIENEISDVLGKASSGSLSDLLSLVKDVENFINSLP